MEELIPYVATLLIGLGLGYFGHWLQIRRARTERAAADATELWDRCGEVASARVKYILAYHRKA